MQLTDNVSAPHVGHMYTMVLSDVIKRYQLLHGRRALLCTGTDEHGMKVIPIHEHYGLNYLTVASRTDPASCGQGTQRT